jgi:hypothetical protein
MLWGFRGRSTAPGPDSSALAVLAHRWAIWRLVAGITSVVVLGGQGTSRVGP